MAYTKEAIERELALEEEMFNRGKDRFFANIARLKEQRNEGGTTYGKMLLKRGIAPLAAAITAFMEKANSGTAGRRHMAVALLKDIAPDVAAFITLRTAIDTLTSEPMLQNVAVRVGREIEAELRLTNLKQNDADRYAMTQRYIQGHKSRKYRSTVLRYAYGKSTTVDFEPWPLAQCLHLGQKLIELAIDSTGIFAIELTSNKVRKGNKDMAAYSLVMTPALKEWMDDHLESRSIMAPAYMPTLIPPKPWEGACGGGYYFQAMRPLSLVKTGNRDYLLTLDKKIANNEMPSVLRAINALQDTPWRVNRQVYEVADHFWNDTNGDGLPNEELTTDDYAGRVAPYVALWEEEKARLEEEANRPPTEEELAAQAVAEARVQSRSILMARMQADMVQTGTFAAAEFATFAKAGLFTDWAAGQTYAKGYRLAHKGIVYEVMQEVTSLENQPPDAAGMLAVYRPLSVDPETGEEPDGSREHPFAFLYGMDVTKDSYYTYEGKLWLAKADMPACVWTPGTAGLWQWEEASAA